jgi:hypothetical protein
MINQRTIAFIGWSVLVALVSVAIAVGSPRRSMPLAILAMWCVACFAYTLAVSSRLSVRQLLKNAFLACSFVAAVTYCNHGKPETDEDGFTGEDGFDATEREKGAAAVDAFGRFGLATLGGVGVALLVRRSAGYQRPSANDSTNEPVDDVEDESDDGADGDGD